MSQSNLPPLTWLRAFESAARHLSFTAAADELNLTQSAISQHVRRLEGYLGRELFIRRTRSIQMTEAGANYLPIIREAFEILSTGTKNFTDLGKKNAIVIQCNLSFSTYWLAPRLQKFHQDNPDVSLNIVTPIWDPERHAKAASVEVRFGRESDMPTNAMKISSEVCYPVCHPDYELNDNWTEQAQLYDCSGVTSNWNSWAQSNDVALTTDNPIHLASTYVITMTAALNMGGITISHDMLAKDLIQQGQLIRPFDQTSPMQEGYYLLHPPNLDQNPISQRVMDWLLAEMKVFHET